MYNWRYHIATLVAVFLALAVGLLLGTIVVERGVLDAQKTTLVEGIRKDLDKKGAAIQDLTQSNDALTAYAAATAPELTRGVLLGRTVLIVADPDSGDAASRAADAVRQAGGAVAQVTVTRPGLALEEPAVRDAVMVALGSPDPAQLAQKVTETLAREWTTADASRALTKVFSDVGVLRVQGLAPGLPVSGAVLSAAFESRPDTATVALGAAIAATGRPVVSAEASKRRAGLSKAAVDSGLSAVDDIDSTFGSVSLVWVLAGRASGHFGTGAGAVGPFPEPLFSR
jgi:hypothetical protein